MKFKQRSLVGATLALLATVGTVTGASAADQQSPTRLHGSFGHPVQVEILSPELGDDVGTGGSGWLVNLSVRYPGRGDSALSAAGFTAPQLTGPAGHASIAPFPGTFGPGKDDRLPGLVVLASTTTGFSGPGTNLANLFNLTGVGDRSARSTEVLDSWIVGAPLFGVDTGSTLTVAVVDDLDGDGVYDDAPDVVPDANSDGRIDLGDLEALGLASDVETVTFRIDG